MPNVVGPGRRSPSGTALTASGTRRRSRTQPGRSEKSTRGGRRCRSAGWRIVVHALARVHRGRGDDGDGRTLRVVVVVAYTRRCRRSRASDVVHVVAFELQRDLLESRRGDAGSACADCAAVVGIEAKFDHDRAAAQQAGRSVSVLGNRRAGRHGCDGRWRIGPRAATRRTFGSGSLVDVARCDTCATRSVRLGREEAITTCPPDVDDELAVAGRHHDDRLPR